MLGSQKPLIISASRRTDIPAFYGEWFMRRIREGWVFAYNPYNHRAKKVSLATSQVAAIVFWSKNFRPFLGYLDELDSKGYNMVFLYTITGLPQVFENRVPEATSSISIFQMISKRYSPKHIQWRYDPILVSTYTDWAFHLKTFKVLCQSLEGYTTRCYTSFANLYSKVRRRLNSLEKTGIKLIPISEEEQSTLVNELAEIALQHGIQLYSCCNDHLVGGSIKKAHCVDVELLGDLFQINKMAYKIKPTRKECACYESVDIGMYDTCSHDCVYCYANTSFECPPKNLIHDPDFPLLIKNKDIRLEEKEINVERGEVCQQQVFNWE